MRVVITGAAGFIGEGLAQHLLDHPDALGEPVTELVLADNAKSGLRAAGIATSCCGDLTDVSYLDRLFGRPVDCLFHLASMPGSAAEKRPDGGRAINLDVPLALAERLKGSAPSIAKPRFVFASTVAVYGAMGPRAVTEDHTPRPEISYGAHKLMAEVFLADLSRRDAIDARSLRLPGIIARPPSESGHGSAFMSQIFHAARCGGDYVCPVGPAATAWWMSRSVCIRNLVHAARVEQNEVPASRCWQLPVLHASVKEVVDALGRRFGEAAISRICYHPDRTTERLFGSLPEMTAAQARKAGFTAEADADELVANVFALNTA